jgi:hypothetical protein
VYEDNHGRSVGVATGLVPNMTAGVQLGQPVRYEATINQANIIVTTANLYGRNVLQKNTEFVSVDIFHGVAYRQKLLCSYKFEI